MKSVPQSRRWRKISLRDRRNHQPELVGTFPQMVKLSDEEEFGAEIVAALNRCEFPPLSSILEVHHAS